ncbi:peptidoglycan DD-metalloendopeptidase family protein [Cohnella sp. GCM10027633]|uniref:peptidoglycan DD-metalloendopeptidase family protein n=1 Tax=unclassified Cohnella TaxID=2636738 RepID=UPI0036383132
MADFRGTDRIRNAKAALQRTFRRIRSLDLKDLGWRFDARSSALFIKRYRAPMIVTVLGLITVASVAVGANKYVEAHTEPYYNVLLDGVPVGEISNPSLVDELISNKAAELKKADTPVLAELDEQTVTYTDEKAYKKQTDDAATLDRLSSMLTTHPVGVTVMINGKSVGVVRDQQTADALLQKVKDKYAVVKAAKTGAEVQSLAVSAKKAEPKVGEKTRTVTAVSFAEKVTTKAGEIETAKLADPDKLYEELTKGEPVPRKYTVQEGDCIGCIADKLDVSEEIIYNNNPWIEKDMIRVGDELDLSTEKPPILNVNSTEEVVEIEVIDPPIEYRTNDDMKVGQTKVISQGKEGKQEVTYRILKRNGSQIEEEIVKQKVLKAATPTIIMKGTKVIRGEGSGKFIWPVSGHRITSYLGKRWGRMHNGIDMVGGSTIKAADEGVVTFAGYKGELGNCIIINHQNGFQTVYGHMKSLKVKKGQIVEKGDQIGVMGSTGRSTGTHLHFEIHLNGKLKNPTSYL